MNDETMKLFEDEGSLFARYWLSSKMTPVIDAETFERIIEPHFSILMQGWENKNLHHYPETDEDIDKFLKDAEEALLRGWNKVHEESKDWTEQQRIWAILNNNLHSEE